MSEFWVAHKKYFCKYCNIYIADDVPSRRQHETGLRHKGNVERFVRGLYKAGEKRKQDQEEEKREMARIEKAAGAAYAQDVGAGFAKANSNGSGAGPSSAGPKKVAAPKPSNAFANYSTAESLGYTDPDAERAKAEAERRRTQGVAGEWQFVDVELSSGEQEGGGEAKPGEAGVEARAGEKRPADGLVDEEDTRGWKLRRKTARVGLDDLYDPGELPIKLKSKKEAVLEQSGFATGAGLGGGEEPKWSARGWNRSGASPITTTSDKADSQAVKRDKNGIKDEESDSILDPGPVSEDPHEVKAEEVKPQIVEPTAPPPSSEGSLFKKRKVPLGGGSRGGRRI